MLRYKSFFCLAFFGGLSLIPAQASTNQALHSSEKISIAKKLGINMPKIHLPKMNVYLPSLPKNSSLPANFAWQGFYVGAELGRSISQFHNMVARSQQDDSPDQDSLDKIYGKPSGMVGDVFAGYNRDLGHHVIAGLEGNLGLSQAENRQHSDAKVKALYEEGLYGSLRGRLGYDLGRALPYIAAGPSFVQLKSAIGYITNNKLNGRNINSKYILGYNLGGGVDYLVGTHILVRADYRYRHFRDPAVQCLDGQKIADDGATDLGLSSQNIKLGLAYKF